MQVAKAGGGLGPSGFASPWAALRVKWRTLQDTLSRAHIYLSADAKLNIFFFIHVCFSREKN
jgi:hypothetical protein